MNPGKHEMPLQDWVRFSEYEIIHLHTGAFCIAPKYNAKLVNFNPWDEYQKSKRHTSGQPPYVLLFNMLDRIGSVRYSDLLTPAQQTELLDWCCTWGLLGLVPQRLVSLVLGEELHYSEMLPNPQPGRPNAVTFTEKPWHTRRLHIRKHAGTFIAFWHVLHSDAEKPTFYPLDKTEALVLPDAEVPAVAKRIAGDQFREYMERYFYGLSWEELASFSYPIPLSEQFWEMYGEPVKEFLSAASALRRAVEWLYAERSRVGGGSLTQDQLNQMSAYMGEVAQIPFVSADGSFQVRYRYTSLLAIFAQMAMNDVLAGEGRLEQCRRCQKSFLADAYQEVYCSSRCGLNYRASKIRTKKRKAQELRDAGRSHSQIATVLNQSLSEDSDSRSRVTVRQVKEWLKKGNPNAKASRA